MVNLVRTSAASKPSSKPPAIVGKASDLTKIAVHRMLGRVLVAVFNKRFEIILADEGNLLEEAMRIRYDHFVTRKKFEPENELGLESDRFDKNAKHRVIRHKESGLVIGTARTIFPDPEKPLKSFPMQEVCDHPFLHDPTIVPHFCEISRLLTMPKRLRHIDVTTDFQQLAGLEGRKIRISEIGRMLDDHLRETLKLGLFAGTFEDILSSGRDGGMGIMVPELIGNLKNIGFVCTKLGDTVSFHGERQPVAFRPSRMFSATAVNPAVQIPYMFASQCGRLHMISLRIAEELEPHTRHLEDFHQISNLPALPHSGPPPVLAVA